MENLSLQIQKANLYKAQVSKQEIPKIQSGEILLKIEKFALTSNNITYAVSGEKLRYWSFFPVEEPWGIIPAWGFAEVVESLHPEISVGERCYGYFPMSSYWTLQPTKVSDFGFRDGVEHRAKLPSLYNHYMRVSKSPSFPPPVEDYQPIVHPLFATSFLAYHFLKDQDFFGAKQIALTSASSKTGLALAYMLHQNRESDGLEIVGLTSPSNLDFVKSTGYYDQVISYDLASTDLLPKDTVIVDFAGNAKLMDALRIHLADALKHIVLIGLTDWKSTDGFKEGPKSAFFFVPAYIREKYQEWGPQKTTAMINQAMAGFVAESKNLIEITYVDELAQLRDLYLEMLDGKVDPKKGYIIRPNQ